MPDYDGDDAEAQSDAQADGDGTPPSKWFTRTEPSGRELTTRADARRRLEKLWAEIQRLMVEGD